MKTTFVHILALLMLPLMICSKAHSGTPGQLDWKVYPIIYDDEIGQLTALSTFPTMPDDAKTIFKTLPLMNYHYMIDGQIRGFLNVPEATTATFNITGDVMVTFYLSTDETPDSLQLIAHLDDHVSVTDHDVYPSQTSLPIDLIPGVDYYFELNYTEGNGGNHASIYWKTDLIDTSTWHLISAAYLKGIESGPTECPAAGTPCDDGDSSTTNDVHDGNCNCAGTVQTSNANVAKQGLIESYHNEELSGGAINKQPEDADQISSIDISKELLYTTDDKLHILVDRLNVILAQGRLTQPSIDDIVNKIKKFDNQDEDDVRRRLKLAMYLVKSSPEYLINK